MSGLRTLRIVAILSAWVSILTTKRTLPPLRAMTAGQPSTSAVGFIPNGEVHLTAWPWRWLGLSLGATVAWPVAEPVYISTRHSAPQAMLVPRLLFAIGAEVLIALDVDIAAGGPASGTASAALSARLAL